LEVRPSDAFNRAVTADGFLIGTYVASALDGSKILPLTEPLFDAGGKKIGFIFAALQLDWLKQQFAGRFADPNISLLVVDRNSTMLLRIPDPERWVGTQLDAKYSQLLHATADGTAEITGVDGVRRIVGYSPLAVDPVGIYVGVGLTKAAVFAAIDSATLKGAVLVALCLCLALVAAWLGGIAFLRRPIDALLQAAESWRRGEYSARTGITDPRSELARLGRAFDDMAAELERREREIRQANELLEQRVAERTTELVEANRRLATETEERRRAEAVLHHAQKLESIGQLTSGVAHDFNNLLTAVLGNLEIACMRVTDETVLELLASATRAAERGAHLNEQLLAFARRQHLQRRPVNVNQLVRGMGEMLKHSIGASVHIEQRLTDH
jgi:signal transduction histidine kinase